jgi:hypothetical protein
MMIISEWFRSSEGNGSFPSPAASPQPAGGVSGPFGQSNFPMASGMVFYAHAISCLFLLSNEIVVHPVASY